jgi:uncharacterized damage-inducible protein DinB
MREDAQQMLDRLDESARQIVYLVMDCDPEDLTAPPGEGEWSIAEILAHIKASDDILPGRVAMLLTHPRPEFQRFDERAWAAIAGYAEAPADQTLMAYQRRRGELIGQLRRLPDDAWDRTAHHEERGTISLLDLLRSAAEHEEEHVAQLEELLGEGEDD